MADKDQLSAWLRQAKADLDAGRAAGMECHRRYWLQQACEKGTKALGLVLWQGPARDAGSFSSQFLYKHSPLKSLEAQTTLPKSLKLLLRAVSAELDKLDGSKLLRQVDSTTPTIDPTDVSYRYPFRDNSGSYVAPCDLKTSDWDEYQGNFAGVAAAVDRFLKAVDNRMKRERGPK